jgi:predicted nucleotidyltransferase
VVNHKSSVEDLAMRIDELLKQKRDEIFRIASRHGATNVRVFGSAVYGELRADSDIDFLVDLESDRSLFDLGDLLLELQELLGRKVDIVTEQSIYWLLRRRILKEAVPL